MAAASELPQELIARPLGLITITGLDIEKSAVHKAIWESFSTNRQHDRVPLYIDLVSFDHKYPLCKQNKRTSYEFYSPRGILKKCWMYKHLYQVPAVEVVFFELDWDDLNWKEKQSDCAARVESVRKSLQGRGTKVAVVLIQKNTPLPPGEDMQAAERAAALCSACELSAKSLFVLPHTDHLFGYTIRLENAFYELAQGYYHGEARRVKSHKEFLNKQTSQVLFVRHQFKIAFFSELRQDPHSALKHYRQAYQYLTEVKLTDLNVLEVKVVAGFINYKICRLNFQGNAPLDAISQFRKHMDIFKDSVGPPELAFEHSAWFSKQNSIFAELFDEAIKNGLAAIQTQHPGFYFQQAANHAVVRRQLCQGLCHTGTPPSLDPLQNSHNVEYFGQRPWQQGIQGIEYVDAALQHGGILALQTQEIMVDHSWLIIPLLSSAVAQFKKYKCPRMKRYLMVLMGEEYYHARDYSRALALLGHVTWDYRRERWWQLLTSILITSLRCAYLVGSVQEYVTLSIELMGKFADINIEERTRIQMNLIRVLANDCPEPEHGCDVEAVEEAKEIWKKLPTKGPEIAFTVELENLVPFVECKTSFNSQTFSAEEEVQLTVFLRVTCPFPIKFTKLAVLFTPQVYSKHCIIDNSDVIDEESYLYLEPYKVQAIPFKFVVQPAHVGQQIKVSNVALELGAQESRCAILLWRGGGGDAVPTKSPSIGRPRKTGDISWEELEICSTTKIISREPKLDIFIEHSPPSLVGEFFSFIVRVVNQEEIPVTNLNVTICLKDPHDPHEDGRVDLSLDEPIEDENSALQTVSFTLDKLDKKVERKLFLKSSQVGKRTISAKATYDIEVLVGEDKTPAICTCSKENIDAVDAVLPLVISMSLTNLKFEHIERVHEDEPFLILTNIKCTSSWPLTITKTDLQLCREVTFTDEPEQSLLHDVCLQKDECAASCVYAVASIDGDIQRVVSLGKFSVEWKRIKESFSGSPVHTELNFPPVTIESLPFSIHTDMPAYGCVREALSVCYTIKNRTCLVQEVEANMEPSDAFMFSGLKQVHFRLLPLDEHHISYVLYPLLSGHVALPRLHLKLPRFYGNLSLENVAQRLTPSHVFIKPRGQFPAQAVLVS